MRRLLISFLLLAPCVCFGKVTTTSTDPDEVLALGREAFLDYRFDDAATLYSRYRSLRSKSRALNDEYFDKWTHELDLANKALERVQILEIVDTISVPAGSFFKSYKLSDTAGRIGTLQTLGETPGVNSREVGFLNEFGNYLIIPVEQDGELVLMENRKLLDGSWETYESLEGDFDRDGDYAFPYLAADGQTLYFANNGEDSMGGFDIFIAQRDPITGEYLQPLNLGMPFNSPADDYMLVIDEEKGVGWWASNRDSTPGNVKIFVYTLPDMRHNYPDDTDDLEEKARLRFY